MTNTIASLLDTLYEKPTENKGLLIDILARDDEHTTHEVFAYADAVRKQYMGDGIFLRAIIEFSNHCAKTCAYCGLNKYNQHLRRYRMTKDEIMSSVEIAAGHNIHTIVLQSGEDSGCDVDWMSNVIRTIKHEHDVAITLSVGEQPLAVYKAWKHAGADRYLLKIETTDPTLYATVHPNMSFAHRMQCLDWLMQLGYQTGTGNIIGLNGQTIDSIAEDILFFAAQNFDMIGIGPFIPHEHTPMGNEPQGNILCALKTLALTRIVTRNTHIPAATAFGSIDPNRDYRVQALAAGANVIMPNYTPQPYRKMYEIYPGKRCVDEPIGACHTCLDAMAQSIGRYIEHGRGDSMKE